MLLTSVNAVCVPTFRALAPAVSSWSSPGLRRCRPSLVQLISAGSSVVCASSSARGAGPERAHVRPPAQTFVPCADCTTQPNCATTIRPCNTVGAASYSMTRSGSALLDHARRQESPACLEHWGLVWRASRWARALIDAGAATIRAVVAASSAWMTTRRAHRRARVAELQFGSVRTLMPSASANCSCVRSMKAPERRHVAQLELAGDDCAGASRCAACQNAIRFDQVNQEARAAAADRRVRRPLQRGPPCRALS